MKNKTLKSFIDYCEAHSEQRFWQALRNWSNEYYRDELSHIYRGHCHQDGADWADKLQDTWELN